MRVRFLLATDLLRAFSRKVYKNVRFMMKKHPRYVPKRVRMGGGQNRKKHPPQIKNRKNTNPRSSRHDPCLPPLPPARRQEVPLPYRPLPSHSPTQTHPRTPYFSAQAGHHHMYLRPPGCPCCFCTANLFSYAIILKHPCYSVPATAPAPTHSPLGHV